MLSQMYVNIWRHLALTGEHVAQKQQHIYCGIFLVYWTYYPGTLSPYQVTVTIIWSLRVPDLHTRCNDLT